MKVGAKLGVIALLLLQSGCSSEPDTSDAPATFGGPSTALKSTDVVPTLETRVAPERNIVWCASFQSAWTALQDLLGGPVSLEGDPEIARDLNHATDLRSQIPPECLYVAAGWADRGIVGQIQTEMQRRFPVHGATDFSGLLPHSFVAYAYIEANLSFPVQYDRSPSPLVFRAADGERVEVRSFGILAARHRAHDKVWDQPSVLFRRGEPVGSDFEFAVDLCSASSQSQIVLARIAAEPTLAAAVARVDKEAAEMPERRRAEAERYGQGYAEHLGKLEPFDNLLVPELHWYISHRFKELEGKSLKNANLGAYPISAQQDILFRLDRSGVRLQSKATMYYMGVPAQFFFDRPFLVYLRRRGAKAPYFVMWVSNGELLRPWRAGNER